ncbi:hypothetical protein HK099_000998 [Clydaea vesicula]|uniref:Uncharacterized protein n=1 Tax=Clydaea vesicula TaxID=447962 RepID=A0AAD5XSC9_9FUNG|nr:hypothetical protein HK099_000998 [Clydaea vesicula]
MKKTKLKPIPKQHHQQLTPSQVEKIKNSPENNNNNHNNNSSSNNQIKNDDLPNKSELIPPCSKLYSIKETSSNSGFSNGTSSVDTVSLLLYTDDMLSFKSASGSTKNEKLLDLVKLGNKLVNFRLKTLVEEDKLSKKKKIKNIIY